MTQDRNEEAVSKIVFNPCLTTDGTLAEIFRIFTSGPAYNKTYCRKPTGTPLEPVTAFIKGVSKPLLGTGQGSLMGAGVSFVDRNDLDINRKWFSLEQDTGGGNNLLAILLASMKVGINTL